MTTSDVEPSIQPFTQQLGLLKTELGKAIVGHEDVIEQLLIAMLAGGHALLEGVPGLGKTLLVRSLAEVLDVAFKRVQFTPDLMPSDIIGTDVLEEDQATGKRHFVFRQGPVFTQLLLADEINRTPAKTQAALLEAMQEHAVTFAGQRHALPEPFMVVATQNPIEQAGTYPLPEAQLDRFLLSITLDYPSHDHERDMVQQTTGTASEPLNAVMSGDELLEARALVRQVHVSDDMVDYAVRLVRATRPSEHEAAAEWVRWGAGPRAAQALVLCAKARALIHGRLAATRGDISALVLPVLRHRVVCSYQAQAERVSVDDVIQKLVANIHP